MDVFSETERELNRIAATLAFKNNPTELRKIRDFLDGPGLVILLKAMLKNSDNNPSHILNIEKVLKEIQRNAEDHSSDHQSDTITIRQLGFAATGGLIVGGIVASVGTAGLFGLLPVAGAMVMALGASKKVRFLDKRAHLCNQIAERCTEIRDQVFK